MKIIKVFRALLKVGVEKKSAPLASVLSLLVIGLGQVYAGRTERGLTIFAVGYCLIALDFVWTALSITAHPPHLSISPFHRLVSMGGLLLGMLSLAFWIHLLLYGLVHTLSGSPLVFVAPAGHTALILSITGFWIWQILDAYKVARIGSR